MRTLVSVLPQDCLRISPSGHSLSHAPRSADGHRQFNTVICRPRVGQPRPEWLPPLGTATCTMYFVRGAYALTEHVHSARSLSFWRSLVWACMAGNVEQREKKTHASSTSWTFVICPALSNAPRLHLTCRCLFLQTALWDI